MWFRKWRGLLIVYAVATGFAVREIVVSRTRGPVEWPNEAWSRMVDVVGEVSPGEADTEWLKSMEARAEGNEDEFVLRLEEALATDIKHNEYLLQDYTQLMLDRGADYRLINWAANRWRENHPFSAETLRLALGSGPADEAEARFLEEVLTQVPWIGGARLERYTDGGAERWRVHLSFRPPQEVDIRQAVEAATLLALSEQQLATYRVSCLTLVDCRLVERQ